MGTELSPKSTEVILARVISKSSSLLEIEYKALEELWNPFIFSKKILIRQNSIPNYLKNFSTNNRSKSSFLSYIN